MSPASPRILRHLLGRFLTRWALSAAALMIAVLGLELAGAMRQILDQGAQALALLLPQLRSGLGATLLPAVAIGAALTLSELERSGERAALEAAGGALAPVLATLACAAAVVGGCLTLLGISPTPGSGGGSDAITLRLPGGVLVAKELSVARGALIRPAWLGLNDKGAPTDRWQAGSAIWVEGRWVALQGRRWSPATGEVAFARMPIPQLGAPQDLTPGAGVPTAEARERLTALGYDDRVWLQAEAVSRCLPVLLAALALMGAFAGRALPGAVSAATAASVAGLLSLGALLAMGVEAPALGLSACLLLAGVALHAVGGRRCPLGS